MHTIIGKNFFGILPLYMISQRVYVSIADQVKNKCLFPIPSSVTYILENEPLTIKNRSIATTDNITNKYIIFVIISFLEGKIKPAHINATAKSET